MAYPTYPAAPENRSRPGVVTASTYLLWITAAASLISGIVSVSFVGRMSDAYADVYAGTELEGSEGLVVAFSIGAVVVNVLVAAGLAILAIFNNRGRNGARITTWVIGGLMVCCGLLGLAAIGAGGALDLSSGSSDGPTAQELEDRLSEAMPSWYDPVTVTLSVVSVLAVLGAVILLLLPASNRFFRKPAAGWDPSQPYPYPGSPYGAPPANPYGAPPASPYGAPPASPHGVPPASPYGVPPANPYGAPPANPYGAPPSDPYGPPPASTPPAGHPPSPAPPSDPTQVQPPSGPAAGQPPSDPWRPPSDGKDPNA